VLADLPGSARAAREEIFGPVLNINFFEDLDDVVLRANDTAYGLAAEVWTRDVGHVHGLAKRIRAGTIWVNCALVSDYSMPFGGYRQSGWGREYGLEGLDAFQQTKSVFVKL
jgi:acyl-CoA reductase-like NAD-dependent aldehyde dehydrogenase